MKERVEKKLGCTIEECCRRIEKFGEDFPYEAEYRSPFSVLDESELDFVIEYLERKQKRA